MSLLVNEHAPKTDSYINTSTNERVNKVSSVFGHNASGKTNLLRVLPFLKWFITLSFNTKPEEEIPFKTFFFNKIENKDTEFNVIFECNQDVYEYNLVLSTKKIKTEKLHQNNKIIFTREWNDNKKEYINKFNNFPKGFDTLIRDNASAITTGAQAKHELSIKIYNYWDNIISNVVETGKVLDVNQIFKSSKIFYKNPKLKERAEKLLSQFEIGLSRFEIEEHKFSKGEDSEIIYVPSSIHSLRGVKDDIYMSFPYWSHGTQNLYSLLPYIFNSLEKGSVIILDEFDADLHPQMLPVLIDLFIAPKHNPKNAQLIFSSHSPLVLNYLDKYQIYFTEKDKNCSSCVWRLSDVRGVRSDDNYYAKYISGAYGAGPDIDLD